MDVEGLLKDLANCKLQMEAKEAAYKQALIKQYHHQKIADELTTLLKKYDDERKKYVRECTEARTCMDELESKVKEMAEQLAETARMREQLLRVLNELKAAQEELFRMETELAAARDLQLKAVTQAELMESAARMEKENSDMLSRHLSQINEAICMSDLVVREAHNEKMKILSERNAEIKVAQARAAQAEEQLDYMKRQLEMMLELEIQLLEKSILSDLLQLELEQSIEKVSSSDKAALDVKQVKEEMEVKERGNTDKALLRQSKLEVKKANEEMESLESNAGVLTEIAESFLINSELVQNPSQDVAIRQADEWEKLVPEDIGDDQNDAYVIISAAKYELLIKKAAKTNEVSMALVEYANQPENYKQESEIMKKNMEVAMAKIRDLRNRAEQAATRADAAEKAKAGLEDQIRRYQEQKQKKNAALVALKEVTAAPKTLNFPTYEPLGKVLNMKFYGTDN